MGHMSIAHSWLQHRVVAFAMPVALASSIVGSTLLLSAQNAWGQAARLVPSIVELDTQQGQAQGAFTVNNTSTTDTLRARLYAEAFTYADNGFTPEPNSKFDLTPYIIFSPRELTIAPGQSRQVRLIARLPAKIVNSEYRAVVYVENLNESPTSTTAPQNRTVSQIGVVTRLGAAVYVRQGNVAPKLSVIAAKYDDLKKQIKLAVQNSGNGSTRTRIEWTLKRGDTVIATQTEALSSIVGQSSRSFPISYPKQKETALVPGTYNLSGKITWVDQGWALNSSVNPNVVPFDVSFPVTNPLK